MRNVLMKGFLFFLLLVIITTPLITQESMLGKEEKSRIEVVLNPAKPQKIKNLPSQITLIKEMVIDPEKMAADKFIAFGVFDVDKEGNIFIFDPKLVKIVVFDRKGVLKKSIGREGQGPGEMVFVTNIHVRSHEFIVTDIANRKFCVYRKNGEFVKDIRFNKRANNGVPLNNGNFLFSEVKFPTREMKEMKLALSLYNPDFQKINELCNMAMLNPLSSKIEGIYFNLSFDIYADKIFIGNKEKNYEIHVYNFDGRLIKIIKKAYSPTKPSQEYKKNYIGMLGKFYNSIKDKLYFPEFLPPYYDFLLDEEGRLFVMTYDKKKSTQEYVFDIFSPEGIFFARKYINAYMAGDGLKAKIKNDRLYIVCEKEEDYQTLNIYQIKWE